MVNINLKVKKGQFLTLFGPNGAGKTTLIRLLSTLIRPTSGKFYINKYDVNEDPGEIRQSIGMISHSPLLYDELTPLENLQFYGKMFYVEPSKLDRIAKDLIRKIGLHHRMYDRVETFSRGMKQRVSIARAIIHKPQVLLLDEPYTGLDQNASRLLEKILDDFKRKKGTVILATHNIERGLNIGDRIAVLINGNIRYDAESDGLDPTTFSKEYQQLVKGKYA